MSPRGTDSGGRGGGLLHRSREGRRCAWAGRPPPPGARGAGMELFQAKDHYILQQGERALWCSRRDGGLQLRPGEALGEGWVGRAGQLERGGRGPAPPERGSRGWAGRLGLSALVLRGAAAASARSPASVRRERPVTPFSAPPPVSGSWGAGNRVPHEDLAGLHLQRLRTVQRGKFWVPVPSVQWNLLRDTPC